MRVKPRSFILTRPRLPTIVIVYVDRLLLNIATRANGNRFVLNKGSADI